MNFQKSTLAACAVLALAAVSTQANAFSVLIQPGVSFSTQVGVAQIDLGNVAVVGNAAPGDVVYAGTAGGVNYTFTDGSLYTASVPAVTAQPIGSVGAFWSVGKTPTTQNGPGVVDFGAGAQYVGFLWGSVDTYNSVSIYSGATLLGTYNGASVATPTNGTQFAYFNAFGTSSQKITSMVFNSPLQNAFETDNFAVSAVPETETYAMLLAGLGLMGTIARRRNKSKSV